MPRDWADAPFVQVYQTLARDHPAVWNDLRLSGAWLHCLMAARAVWGLPFTPPREVADELVAMLIADDVLDPVGTGLYTFHGLDAELNGQASRGRSGGLARAKHAPRIGGRFAGGDAGRDAGGSRSDAGGSLVADAGAVAGTSDDPSPASLVVAGDQRTSEYSREQNSRGGANTSRAPSTSSSTGPRASARPTPDAREVSPDPAGVGVARSEVGGGRYGTPDVPTCSDPATHGSDWRYYVGVGWRCLVCDAERPGEPSFREKARDAGAKL
jgi:hypothetical protein